MGNHLSIDELRKYIDETDTSIIELLERRMELAREVAKAKAIHGKSVFDPERERAVLKDRVSKLKNPEFASQTQRLFLLLMEMSKELQEQEISQL